MATSAVPASAMAADAQVRSGTRRPRKIDEKSGTSFTLRYSRKQLRDAEVVCSPTAWNAYPRNIHAPSSPPARHGESAAGGAEEDGIAGSVEAASVAAAGAAVEPSSSAERLSGDGGDARAGKAGEQSSAAMRKRAKFSSAGESVVSTASLITACCVPHRMVTALRIKGAGNVARNASTPPLPLLLLLLSSSPPLILSSVRGGIAAAIGIASCTSASS